MRRKLLKIFLGFTLLLLILTILFVVLYSFTPVVDTLLLDILNTHLGEKVQITYDRLEGNLLGTIRLLNVNLSAPGFSVSCKKISLQYSPRDLVDNYIKIHSIMIDSPLIRFLPGDSTTQTPAEPEELFSAERLSQGLDLTGLPNLTLISFMVKNGKIVVGEPGNESQHFVDLNMEITGELTANNATARLKYIKGRWEEKDISLNELSFQLIGNKKRLTINQLNAIIEDNKIFAHGEIELMPRLRFLVFADTSTLEIPLLRKLVPDLPYQEGKFKFYVDYIGVPSDFTGQLYFSGKLDSLAFHRISGRYDYRQRYLNLRDIFIDTNFGELYGAVEIAPEGRNNISLNFRDINLNKSGLTPLTTHMDGWINLRFNTWNLAKITGTGRTQITDLRYGTMYCDTLFLNLEAERGFWNLKPGSRLVVQEESQFFVEGTMTADRQLNIDLTTDHNRLDTLSRRLDLGEWGGLGSLSVNIGGPLHDPDVLGSVLLDSLVVSDLKTFGVEGNFKIDRISSQRKGYFQLEMASGLATDIMVTDGVVDLRIDYNSLLIDSLSFYNEDNYVTVKGALHLLANRLKIDLHDFIFQYQDYRIYSTDTLMAFYEGDSIFIENFILKATGEGEIEVRGMVHLAGNSGLGVYFKNIQLLPFNQFIQWKYPLQGILEISFIVSGNPDTLMVQGLLDLEKFSLGDDFIGDLEAQLTYQDEKIEIDYFNFHHSPTSFLSVSGNMLLPRTGGSDQNEAVDTSEQINFKAHFENIQLSDYPFFKDQNYPFTGNFSGDFQLDGTLSEFLANYSFLIKDLQYREYQFPRIQLAGYIDPRTMVLENGDVNFMNTHISVTGEKPISWNYPNLDSLFANREISVFITIQEDSLQFLPVLTPEVDLLVGDILVALHLTGNYDAPVLNAGRVEIGNGLLYLSKIENPLQKLEFLAEVQNQRLEIRRCKARSTGNMGSEGFLRSVANVVLEPLRKIFIYRTDDGAMEMEGYIDLADLTRPDVNLRLKANKFFVNYYLENVRLFFSTGNLTITGQDTLLLAGNITIHQGEVELDLEESEKNLLLTTSVRETPPYLHYLLSISMPGNFYIRSNALFNSFEMMLMGELQIIQEPKGLLEMYGTLDVPKGKYFQFEEFNVRDGRVDFVNPKELPRLNIYAEKKKYGYLFQLRVEGDMTNPIKEIRIFDMQTREDVTHLYPETKDQIALLLFGMTFKEIGGSAGTVALDKGQEVINQAILSRIEEEARRFIGLDQVRVETEGGLIDFTNLRLNQVSEKSAISLGKYIMPNLYLEYKTQLGSSGVASTGDAGTPKVGWEVGNQIYLEYRINRNWSVSSFYAKQLYDKFKIDVNWRHSF